jgi:hypothetical protein
MIPRLTIDARFGRCLLLAALALATAAPALAQSIRVAPRYGPDFTCVSAEPGETFEASVFIEDAGEFTAVQFAVDLPAGLSLVSWERDAYASVHNGDPLAGIQVGWNDCQTAVRVPAAHLILEVASEITEAPISVVGHPDSAATPLAADCSPSGGLFELAPGADLVVNPTEPCPEPSPSLTLDPQAVSHVQAPDRTETVLVTLRNRGGATADFQARIVDATPGTGWVQVTPASGEVPGHYETGLFVQFDTSGLPQGSYTARLEVSQTGGGALLAEADISLYVGTSTPYPGLVGLYFDQNGSDCDLETPGGELAYLYVFAHLDSFAATGAELRLELPEGMSLVGETHGPLVAASIGNLASGLALALQRCAYDASLYLVRASLWIEPGIGTAYVRAKPNPSSDFLGISGCDPDHTLHPMVGGVAVINGNCILGEPIAVHETTWGAIKTLYRRPEE